MAKKLLPAVIGMLLWAAGLHGVRAQEAPFGLSWGPVTTVRRPSMVDREGNITALFYFRDQPLTPDADTQEIVLEVCKDEGLQQVLWISRPLSEAALLSKYEAIYQEGVRRYGHPQDDTRPQTVLWPAGRTLLAIQKTAAGRQRLIMIASGEQYERCSSAHEAATGHRATVHISELLDGPEGLQK